MKKKLEGMKKKRTEEIKVAKNEHIDKFEWEIRKKKNERKISERKKKEKHERKNMKEKE